MPLGGASAPRSNAASSSALCRLCLSTRGDTRPIFASDRTTLAERIRACVSVQVNEDDGLPSQICKKCVSNVNNWYAFKKVCEDSQLKLRDWLNGDNSADQEVRIKKEPSSEDDDIVIDASYLGVDLIEDGNRVRIQPEGPPILASLGLAPRNEKSNKDPRADWDRVVAIQNIIEKDEAVEGTESADENDVLEVSEADTDSEQELESANEDSEEKNEYRSNDGYVKYSKKMSNKNISESLKRKFISGSNGEASNAQTPLQAWSIFITDTMIETIVYHTNGCIEKYYPNAGITCDLQENLTNIAEIKALFGILYLSGIMRPAFYNSSEMWWADGCGLGIVQLAMSLDRFRFLLKCLRFETSDISVSLKTNDKLYPIRNFLNDFTSNCKTAYNFGSCGVVDECILPFDGPCSFRRSVKTKNSIKNGIKMYTLVESDSFYTGNVEICTFEKGNDEIAQTRAVNDAVKKLVDHMSHSGMTIVTRPRITSFNLVNQLTNEHGLYCVGGLSSKRKEIPTVFYGNKRKCYSSTFGFTESGITLLSFINSRKKSHIVISTRPDHYHCQKVIRNDGVPGALVWYKQRRNAANVANTLSKVYTTSRRCGRWSLVIFLSLLDIAAMNSQVIWLSNRTQADVIYRRNFIRSLALELLNDHIKSTNMSEDKNTNFELDPLLAVRGGPIKNVTSADAVLRRHRRCKLCARNADRKTKSYCVSCSTPVCKEHYKPLCICCALKF